jgi:hypothetical protein
MISRINPTGSASPSPSGDSHHVISAAKLLEKSLNEAIGEISALNPKAPIEPKLSKIAQIVIDLSAQAQQALVAAGA